MLRRTMLILALVMPMAAAADTPLRAVVTSGTMVLTLGEDLFVAPDGTAYLLDVDTSASVQRTTIIAVSTMGQYAWKTSIEGVVNQLRAGNDNVVVTAVNGNAGKLYLLAASDGHEIASANYTGWATALDVRCSDGRETVYLVTRQPNAANAPKLALSVFDSGLNRLRQVYLLGDLLIDERQPGAR